jgi:serine/threonine protein kinase/tetratricopeptide (TPR) repeat protein
VTRDLAALFARAVELQGEERERFLAAAGADDPALRRELEALLVADGAAGDFLEAPHPAARGARAAHPDTPVDADAPGDDPLPGSTLGNYRVLHRIGSGGMSTVYLAERLGGDFPMRVAVKLVKRGLDTEDILRRFVTERRLLAALDHENIARVIDGGVAPDGRPYLMMEYVEGDPIDRYCAGRNLSLRERLEVFRVVCSAVTHAHRALIVHRDLKPGNILVTKEGQVRLLDFGIAKVLDPGDGDAALTATGARLLTPRYASPEQIRGGPTTVATDVYSLGVILYELLTGRSPYRVDQSATDLEKDICETPPVRPSTAVRRSTATGGTAGAPGSIDTRKLSRRLNGDLDVIVMTALRKEPERRYGSVEQLSEDIRRHLAGLPVLARPDTLVYRSGKFIRRNPALVAGVTVVALLVVAFGVLMTRQLEKTAAERDRANREADTARRTVEFLEGLFRVPDPDVARGQTITAREILDRGAARLSTSFPDRPDVKARLLRTIGGVQINLGLYAEARPNIEAALELHRAAALGDSLEYATTLESLANLRRVAGDASGALAAAEEALGIRERTPGHDPIRLSITLSRVAILKTRLRDLEGARALLLRSLELRESVQGRDHRDAGPTVHNLANVHMDLGDFAEAEALYRRSLAMQTAANGPDHPEIAKTLSSLAAVLSELERHAEAESLQLRALDINVRALGPDHDRVGADWSDLALVRKNAGRLSEALEPAERAVALLRRTLGPDHPVLASALVTYGQVLDGLGRQGEALAAGRESLRIFEGRYGSDHPQTADARQFVDTIGQRVR